MVKSRKPIKFPEGMTHDEILQIVIEMKDQRLKQILFEMLDDPTETKLDEDSKNQSTD